MNPITPEILGEAFREHGGALVLYARQWSETPEDVVQEVFLTLANQAAAPPNIAAWLFRSVRNAAIDSARASSRRKRREGLVSTQEPWFTSLEDQFDAGLAADSLAQLDIGTREVIIARIWGELGFEEVAALVGMPLSTVYRKYRAGLEELRLRMEGKWSPKTIKK